MKKVRTAPSGDNPNKDIYSDGVWIHIYDRELDVYTKIQHPSQNK